MVIYLMISRAGLSYMYVLFRALKVNLYTIMALQLLWTCSRNFCVYTDTGRYYTPPSGAVCAVRIHTDRADYGADAVVMIFE